MNNFEIQPQVDSAQEFIEIATDFSNPLDMVREAISNSFDAKATRIDIRFIVEKEYGESILVVELQDNGEGMDQDGLQAFFDLGNSRRRNDHESIGDKGHGTKVYFNSYQVDVHTIRNGIRYEAVMKEPFKSLHNRAVPKVSVTSVSSDEASGTLVRIRGYNLNRRDKFTHARLKDYVLWFTKFGSFELELGITKYKDTKLFLKGLDVDQPDEIVFGHYFPPASPSIDKLFDDHVVDAPDYYVTRSCIERDDNAYAPSASVGE